MFSDSALLSEDFHCKDYQSTTEAGRFDLT
jgi:hypothetical protein